MQRLFRSGLQLLDLVVHHLHRIPNPLRRKVAVRIVKDHRIRAVRLARHEAHLVQLMGRNARQLHLDRFLAGASIHVLDAEPNVMVDRSEFPAQHLILGAALEAQLDVAALLDRRLDERLGRNAGGRFAVHVAVRHVPGLRHFAAIVDFRQAHRIAVRIGLGAAKVRWYLAGVAVVEEFGQPLGGVGLVQRDLAERVIVEEFLDDVEDEQEDFGHCLGTRTFVGITIVALGSSFQQLQQERAMSSEAKPCGTFFPLL